MFLMVLLVNVKTRSEKNNKDQTKITIKQIAKLLDYL